MPSFDVLVDLHKIARNDYKQARWVNFAVYAAFVVSVAVLLYVSFNLTSPLWFTLSLLAVMVATVTSIFRFVWFGTYDRFLKTMAVNKPDSAYAAVFERRTGVSLR